MQLKGKTLDGQEYIFLLEQIETFYEDENLIYVLRFDNLTSIPVKLSSVVSVDAERLATELAKAKTDLDFCVTHAREDRSAFEAHTRRIMQRSADLGLQRKAQIEALERQVAELLALVNAMEIVAPTISVNRLDLVPA